MNLEYDLEADAVYIYLSENKYSYGKDLDDKRRIDFAADGSPVGVELLGVSHGVNINDLPSKYEIGAPLELDSTRFTHSKSLPSIPISLWWCNCAQA